MSDQAGKRTGYAIEIKLMEWAKADDRPAHFITMDQFYEGSYLEPEAKELYAAMVRLTKHALRVKP